MKRSEFDFVDWYERNRAVRPTMDDPVLRMSATIQMRGRHTGSAVADLVQAEFGQIGPTGASADTMIKAGIPWRLAP